MTVTHTDETLLVVTWILRVCVAMTFIGHGYLATQTQAGWFNYLRTAGIGSKVGAPLMKLIGVFDLVCGFAFFFFQSPLLYAWCGIWGFGTALMRPLSGESIHQFIERSGNFLPAVVLLYLETTKSSSEYTFQQWLFASSAIIIAGVLVCVLLRVTGLLAADSTTTKKAK